MITQDFIDEIVKKFGYDDEIKKAIEITIPLLLETYGELAVFDIKDLFSNIQIVSAQDISYDYLNKTEKEIIGDINSHIVEEEKTDPYGSNSVASAYNYDVVYDENMNPIEERKFIAIQDMSGRVNEQGYRDLFGTSINMPYFIHEINHAFAMLYPEIVNKGDKVVAKHGMYTTELEYRKREDGKTVTKLIPGKDIILEESINEYLTQKMLVSLLKTQDYNEVNAKLRSINHVSTSYSPILVGLGEKLIKLFGLEKVMDYRMHNNTDFIQEFNSIASKSDIALENIEGEPFTFFVNKCYDIFQLGLNKYKMPIEEYGLQSGLEMVSVYAPLSSIQDVLYGTIDLEKYNAVRQDIINKYKKDDQPNI